MVWNKSLLKSKMKKFDIIPMNVSWNFGQDWFSFRCFFLPLSIYIYLYL